MQYTGDALEYYECQEIAHSASDLVDVAGVGFEGATFLTTEDVVEKDALSPVYSHYERLFADHLKIILRGILPYEEILMPEKGTAFKRVFEREWRRLTQYGNGHFGFTVLPRISILDMVRYQQLEEVDEVTSWSVANWVIWQMDVFPHGMQHLFPKFRDVALKKRLMKMFDPLVASCATEVVRRSRFDDQQDADRKRVREEFEQVLSTAIEDYDFMFGKEGTAADGVGNLGVASSPKVRERINNALEHLNIDATSHDVAHVGIAHYLSSALRTHL